MRLLHHPDHHQEHRSWIERTAEAVRHKQEIVGADAKRKEPARKAGS
jgi:hypothetical protein